MGERDGQRLILKMSWRACERDNSVSAQWLFLGPLLCHSGRFMVHVVSSRYIRVNSTMICDSAMLDMTRSLYAFLIFSMPLNDGVNICVDRGRVNDGQPHPIVNWF